MELVDKKGYLTLSITLAKDGKVLLRKPEGIRDWFEDIKVRDGARKTRARCSTILILYLRPNPYYLGSQIYPF